VCAHIGKSVEIVCNLEDDDKTEFNLFMLMKHRSRISVSLSEELIEKNRGLIKRSTYVEMLIRRGMELSSSLELGYEYIFS